jgi:predicted GIY-YIG superfamily endonuclease
MQCPPHFFVYWIESDRRAYIGATVDPRRRLRQHNGELAGGASRTRGRQWRFVTVVYGFRTWIETLQFEWALRRAFRGCQTRAARRNALHGVTCRLRWTSRAPLAAEVPLVILDDDALSAAGLGD